MMYACGPTIITVLYGADQQTVLYGIALFCGALMNYSNYFLSYLSNEIFHSFIQINIFVNVASIFTCALMIGVVFQDDSATYELLETSVLSQKQTKDPKGAANEEESENNRFSF